ncbi:MAG: hypothetical protein M0D57_05440 [Sphingobacteriales bacterium JAD_PAG50586_3]|nr:MAG: hypothetical protein M0D57_05440 [Sphingobacteriales bacterium JAD_PAG50586_3]
MAGDFIVYELSRDEVLMQNPVYQAIYTGYVALQSHPEEQYFPAVEFDDDELPLPFITPDVLLDDEGFLDIQKPEVPEPTAHPDANVRSVASDLVMEKVALASVGTPSTA